MRSRKTRDSSHRARGSITCEHANEPRPLGVEPPWQAVPVEGWVGAVWIGGPSTNSQGWEAAELSSLED